VAGPQREFHVAAVIAHQPAEAFLCLADPVARAPSVLAFGAGLIWRRRHDEAERLSTQLDAPDWPLMRIRALRLHALMRLGELGRAEQDLAEIGEQGRASGDVRRRRSPGTHSLTQPPGTPCGARLR
jgi:hypothetical protein